MILNFFSSRYQQVYDNNDQIWKFQRLRLVYEYMDSSVIPPPLNMFSYLITKVYGLFLTLKIKSQSNTESTFYHEPEYVHDKKYAEIFARNQKILANDKIDVRLKQNNYK